MTTMSYKGYTATIEYDADAGIFHGEVADIRDVVTFQGKSVAELKKALAGSIEDYLAFCEQRGEEPDKPFSGQFVVRTDPALHKDVSNAARRAGISLNKFVTATLEKAVRR
ncbi:type II toxin-antitoxin system HicB family antitoxin [Rhodopseudomonas palustris]|nr:type II toxin-antitoxin system HicB family antitoxin [Rhodopseudomonas palustris]